MPRKPSKTPSSAPKRGPQTLANAPVQAKRRVTKQQPATGATKATTVLTALKQPQGATLLDLANATGWQPHSVRGFLSGTVRKRLGLTLTVEVRDGERRYHVA